LDTGERWKLEYCYPSTRPVNPVMLPPIPPVPAQPSSRIAAALAALVEPLLVHPGAEGSYFPRGVVTALRADRTVALHMAVPDEEAVLDISLAEVRVLARAGGAVRWTLGRSGREGGDAGDEDGENKYEELHCELISGVVVVRGDVEMIARGQDDCKRRPRWLWEEANIVLRV
jgi:hypothetical protein